MDDRAKAQPWRRCLTAAAGRVERRAGRAARCVAVAATASLLAACGSSSASRGCTCSAPTCGSDPAAWRARYHLQQHDVPTRASGISGLARDERGHLWAIPEDHRALLELSLDARGRPGAVTEHPLSGITPGLDTESLAFVAPGRLALGTERMDGDSGEGDEIDLLSVAEGRAAVVRRLAMPYARWGIRAVENTGIEGLCAASGTLIAGVEHAEAAEGRRFAHLGRMALGGSAWTHLRLWLTSDTGNLAGLDCRPAPGGTLDVVAIERHFGVARVLRFRIPVEGTVRDIVPRLAADLGCALEDVPNFEGIVWLDGDRVALVTDNDYGGPEGPTRLVVLSLPR